MLQCDNCKSMVTTHKTGAEALFNESFKYFVERLGMVPIASNPYSPSHYAEKSKMLKYAFLAT
ncbi:MAG: hypothetical protein PUG89_09860, partial [Succinivibrio sp.]|nr:hypothetical protein [Succinivibrio sp.]